MASIYEFSGKNPLMEAFNAQNDQFAKQDQETARRKAGSALARGDFSGAANPLLENGQLEAGVRVQEIGRTRDREAASAAKAQEQAALEYTDGLVGNLGKVWGQYKDPARVLQAFDMGAGRLTQLGETPEEVAALRQKFEQDPEFTLTALGKAIEQKKLEIRNVGDEVLAIDPYTGQPVNRMRGARTVNIPEGGALYDIPGTGGMETPAAPTMATPPAQAPRQPQGLAGGPDLSMVDGLLEQTGGQVTSRTRTAARNAEVGGVGDSYHLTGQARDAIPPRGMNTAQYAATLKQNLPGWDVIDEGDHVHIEPGPAMGARKTPQGPYQVASMGETPRGNTTVSAAPQPPQETNGSPRLLVQRPKAVGPKPQSRAATDAEKAALGIPASVPAQIKPDGTFDIIALPKGTADEEKAQRGLQMQIAKARDIIATVDAASSKVNNLTAGFIGGNLDTVKGAPAYDLARQVDTIKANLGFQELQAMRESSPTGGALGAIAVQELIALQATVASLDNGQSPEQLKQNLAKIKTHYSRWLQTVESAGNSQPAPQQSQARPQAPTPAKPIRRYNPATGRIE